MFGDLCCSPGLLLQTKTMLQDFQISYYSVKSQTIFLAHLAQHSVCCSNQL